MAYHHRLLLFRRLLCSARTSPCDTTTPSLLCRKLPHVYKCDVTAKLCSSWKLSKSSNSLLQSQKDSSINSRPYLSPHFGQLLSPSASLARVHLLDRRCVVQLTISRNLSRAINIALKKRPKKVSIPRTLRLIDEDGNNLGIMGSDIALKLADSKNLKLVEVKKAGPDLEAVYRLFTSKQQWDEAKKKKKAAKIDPINVTKDITIFSSIGEHDLAVKMSHLREFLERGNSARVFVQTKYRRGMNEAKEAECRRELVERIVSDLEGLGEKVSENAHQRRGIVSQFRPIK